MFLYIFFYITALVLSRLIKEAVAFGSYPNLLKVTRVTPIHESLSKFVFKKYKPLMVLPFLNKVFERALNFRTSKFYHKKLLFTKSNMASSWINQQLMLYSNSARSVTQHLIVNNILFKYFLTSVRCLVVFVTIL